MEICTFYPTGGVKVIGRVRSPLILIGIANFAKSPAICNAVKDNLWCSGATVNVLLNINECVQMNPFEVIHSNELV